MSNEIFDPLGVPDLDLYVILFHSNGTAWNGTSFETYATANRDNYDLALTELGTSSGIYTRDFPTAIVTAGTYKWVSYQRGTPGSTLETDQRLDTGSVDWTGTASAGVTTGAMSGSDWRNYVLRGGFKRTDKDTEVYEATTDAIQEMRRRFMFQEAQTEAETTDQITVAGDYKLDLETDYGLLQGVVIDDGNDAWPLIQISKRKFDELYPDAGVTDDTGVPIHYCIFNDQINIGPVPDQVTYDYRLTYSRRAGTITSASTAVPFTNLYREVLRDAVLFRLWELMDQYDRAQYFRQKFEVGFEQATMREELVTGDHVFAVEPDDSFSC